MMGLELPNKMPALAETSPAAVALIMPLSRMDSLTSTRTELLLQ